MRSGVAFVLAVMALAVGATAEAQTDVLAPARQGALQCYSPNTQAKTCGALAGYSFDAQGHISNPSDVLIYPNPAIVMHTVSPVELRNGAVCGPLRQEDIDRATFTVDGQAPSDADTQNMRAEFSQQAAPLIGVDVCTTFTQQADGTMRSSATVAGTPHPEMSETVIWVHPGDGYHVAPGG
jgi:hypothetical protein